MKDELDVVAVCDAAGTVLERYAYSAFGRTAFMNASYVEQADSQLGWNFLFHGEFMDIDPGWYNYGFRYYVPELGRWLSRDPIREIGGSNIFAYLSNDPVNETDAFGLAEHLKGKRPSTKGKHQKGQARVDKAAQEKAAREASQKKGTPKADRVANEKARKACSLRLGAGFLIRRGRSL